MIKLDYGVILPGEILLSASWLRGKEDDQIIRRVREMQKIAGKKFLMEARQSGRVFETVWEFEQAEAEAAERKRGEKGYTSRKMAPWPIQPKDRAPSGNRYCRCGCGREVPPPKRAWATPECLLTTQIRCDWVSLRNHIFKRDGYTCVKCPSKANLECDHIRPLSEGGTHDPVNLRTLCRPCHKKETKALLKRLNAQIPFTE